ncbi:MAG: phosphotransferase [Prevotellaceae bacterium]|nr:phosphotransferase [Prevotellaceae bacterium]
MTTHTAIDNTQAAGRLARLYAEYTGHTSEGVTAFPLSGSNRRYFRLQGTPTLIGVYGTQIEENHAFFYIGAHFREKGLPVPGVVARSADDTLYLQEDLGDTSLFDAISAGRATGQFSEEEKRLLHKTIRLLPVLQYAGAEGMDFSRCFPIARFDKRDILWDLNYFKYCFLKGTGIDFREDLLEDDFRQMVKVLLHGDTPRPSFMYRDFQSRNVMIKDGEPWFIDFQGGRQGPACYDVASFLWQAKAHFPDALRRELLQSYMDALRVYLPVDEARYKARLRHFVLFRTLQVLGAYGFRGYYERKPHFLESIPFAMENLRSLLEEPFPEYPYLCNLLQRMAGMERFAPDKHISEETKEMKIKEMRPALTAQPPLVVSITSFSYKRGLPVDTSEHGGGFIFDCRALHNPGRYARYRHYSGKDEPVVRFLETESEVASFLEHVYALVDAATQRYLSRGFTYLSVGFGCTGGQHRSVYCAEQLAARLSRQPGIQVTLLHRERASWQTLDNTATP